MLKFLRKYNKFIMVVGGSLLMVAFLLPQALQQLGAAGPGGTVATYDGGRVSRGQAIRASRELQVLEQIVGGGVLARVGVENTDHWVLLGLEVERLGLAGGPDDGLAFLSTIADELFAGGALGAGATRESAYAFLQNRRTDEINAGTPAEVIDRALAKLRGVYRLRQLVNSPGRISRPETAVIAGDMFDSVVADLAVIEADTDPAKLPEPLSEEDLRAHFETYRDQTAEDNEFGIGYRRPAGMTIESLRIDLPAIASSLAIDEIALEAFYRQAPAKYGNDKAATRDRLVLDYRNAEAAKLVGSAVRAVGNAVARSLASLPPDETGGYRVLPPDWAEKRPSMESLADAARRELPEPPEGESFVTVYESDGVFRSGEEFQQLPGGLANARYGDPSAPINLRARFDQVAAAVKELAGPNAAGLQEGVTFGPLYNTAGSAFFFRILDTRDAGPPESIDEVRTKVMADANRLAHFRLLADPANLESLRERAIAEGLDAVAPEGGLIEGVTATSQTLSATPRPPLLTTINVPEVREAIMEAAQGWAADAIAGEKPVEERMVVVAASQAGAVVVGEITAWWPLTEESYRSKSPLVNQQINEALAPSLMFGQGPLSFAALRERYDYRPVGVEQQVEEEGEADAAGDAGDTDTAEG